MKYALLLTLLFSTHANAFTWIGGLLANDGSRPTFKPDSGYAVPGACGPLPEGRVETMKSGERLQDAYDRLDGAGTLYVPWHIESIQCDKLRIPTRKQTGPVSIIAQRGPNGELASFHCRSEKRDGRLPHKDVQGYLFAVAGEAKHPVAIRFFEADGYKSGVIAPSKGTIIIEGNYLHHGMSNGVSNSNNDTGEGGADVQMCGNEIAHYGQGNTVHGSYIHTSLEGAGVDQGLDGNPSWSKLTYVNNLCHSNPFSHCLKTITNETVIAGNWFYNTLETDKEFSERAGSTLVDVAACAKNTIRNNFFYFRKDSARSLGKQMVGVRNRKTKFRGCDKPRAWSYDIPPVAIPGPAHSSQYWTDLGGEIQFPTVIKNNIFIVAGKASKAVVPITMFGTYPNHETGLGSPSCWLPAPMTWYERSKVYTSGNTYIGIGGSPYLSQTINHDYKDLCPTYFDLDGSALAFPPGPGPSSNMIEIGEGEVIL